LLHFIIEVDKITPLPEEWLGIDVLNMENVLGAASGHLAFCPFIGTTG
jgi:hypothetical protein